METDPQQDLPTAPPETWEKKEAHEVYPVQQVAVEEPVTASEVKDAVKELNPDKNSLESR